jgi:hypothetical protein
VAALAVDAVKQLAVGLLVRPERRGFTQQRAVLQPLKTIMKASQGGGETEQLLITALHELVSDHGHNISSGWPTILHILLLVASRPQQPVVAAGEGAEVIDLHSPERQHSTTWTKGRKTLLKL